MANVKLEHIEKQYKGNPKKSVVDFNIDINDGEFIVLVGPSGCGKSTTLRMIAGLEDITSGKLIIDNKDCTHLAAKDRDIAMVFQNYALYGHMTIYQNMAFSLTLRKENKEVIHDKVMEAAKILGLIPELNKKPNQLSGGQRQRVAVGRAIVRNPKVFLFDEPLSNLDAQLRSSLRRELKLLHHRLNATIIYVTHDQTEALTLANRIVVMSNAHVQQIGTSIEVYNDPNNVFVASFMGTPPTNFLEGIFVDGTFYTTGSFVTEDDKDDSEETKINENEEVNFDECLKIKIDEKNSKLLIDRGYNNKKVIFGIRPEHFKLGNKFDLKVELVERLGAYSLLHGFLGKEKVIAKLPGWTNIQNEQVVGVDYNESLVYFFDEETRERIR